MSFFEDIGVSEDTHERLRALGLEFWTVDGYGIKYCCTPDGTAEGVVLDTGEIVSIADALLRF